MDKKLEIKLKSRGRFLRSFEKTVERTGLFGRLGFGKAGVFAGRVFSERVVLYRKKPGCLSLFALTAFCNLERRNGQDLVRVRFGRNVFVSLIWAAWCILMILAGAFLFSVDWLLALFFLLPGLGWALPLFLYSKKEKARLTEFLQTLAE